MSSSRNPRKADLPCRPSQVCRLWVSNAQDSPGNKGCQQHPPLPSLPKWTAGSWESGLTPNLMAFGVFRLPFVPRDVWNRLLSPICNLSPSFRKKEDSFFFHPQTCLLSSGCCYYSNQDGLEIRLGTPGSLHAARVPKAEATCAPFLVEHGHLLIPWSSPSRLRWWRRWDLTPWLHGGNMLSPWPCVQHKMASGPGRRSPSIQGPVQTTHSIHLKRL